MKPENTEPKTPCRVLVVDDEPMIVATIRIRLERDGCRCMEAGTGGEAIRALENGEFDVVLLDIMLPDRSGMELLKWIKRSSARSPEVIMMTAFGSIDTAVRSLKAGAFDFLTKPFDHMDKIALIVKNAWEKRRLLTRTERLEQELKELTEKNRFENLIGTSPKMQAVFHTIERISKSSSNVLIQGESGTGKELVAQAIHVASPRRDGPFVVINCAALSESILESELFGHEKGAFTGAIRNKKGRFEAGDGGTIFLDEIAAIPPYIQVKLLRVLQEGEIKRVGGTRTTTVDVRIIAAANEDLEDRIKEGGFREDLYYRLNVIFIPLPPLNQRRSDIPLLAFHFVKKYSRVTGKTVTGIAPEIFEIFERHPWEGNVRELENVIEHAVVLAPGEILTPEALPPSFFQVPPPEKTPSMKLVEKPYKEAKREVIDTFNRQYLTKVMDLSEGNISTAADKAGMDRSNFRRLMKQYDIQD